MACEFAIRISNEGESWSFHCSHEWDDYLGVFNLNTLPETSPARQLITLAPHVIAEAFTTRRANRVGQDIVMTLQLPLINVPLEILLRQVEQKNADKQVRMMRSEIDKLKSEVEHLKQVKPFTHLRYFDLTTIKNDKIMRYCQVHRPDYIKFRNEQLNTTEADAFDKWITNNKGVYQEYAARVLRLSMYYGDNHMSDCISGLYGAGCWTTVTHYGNLSTENGGIIGVRHYIGTNSLIWHRVTELVPLTYAELAEL